MPSYIAFRPDEPPDSQPAPLSDFPPINFNARASRALTDAEAALLALREQVRQHRRSNSKAAQSRFKRFVVGAVVAAFCLPTVERIVLHLDDGMHTKGWYVAPM